MINNHLRNRRVDEWVQRGESDKAGAEDVELVHSSYLIESVKLMTQLGGGDLGEAAYASPELLEAALYAAGSAIKASETVLGGRTKHAFSVARPPGHHASRSSAMGLCFFNNVAIAVTKAMRTSTVERVTILDFDDHHGNGTSEIFYSNKDVQFLSIHEYDYEDHGQGHFGEIGSGEAAGTKINIPLLESSPDQSYESAIRRVIGPAIERFRPNLIAVSAGFDAHYADPVGNMDVDSSTFWSLGTLVDSLVDRTGAIGSFWVLEGGYNPLALGPCIEASLAGLARRPKPDLLDLVPREPNREVMDANEEIMDHVLETVTPFW
jgi:acetoin utilization deacetylase AcuC-like enzyme